ncbi:hypothetical protein E2C01_079932 [Portunus trituberculatus]|uniref:Uncharacterized protein n=1 Tax=Portunus trituberculatus TaxID=210409 RepID=A0A5B7ISM0_PORTR|nr:hypothetical protein [Portunus trituberculatus]
MRCFRAPLCPTSISSQTFGIRARGRRKGTMSIPSCLVCKKKMAEATEEEEKNIYSLPGKGKKRNAGRELRW